MTSRCAAIFGYLLILGFVSVSICGETPDPVTPVTVDQSFHFGETNLNSLNDIELFPDRRIAYAGASRFETVGVSGPNGEVTNSDSSGWLLTNALSLAIDPIDRVIYSLGSPGYSEFSAGVQKTLKWDDLSWGSLAKVRGRGNKILQLYDRGLLVAGRLQVTGDPNVYGLVKLDLTGNLVPGFNYASTAEIEVADFELMADGSILAALQQTNENGIAYSYSRFESNGVSPAVPLWRQDSRVSAMARMPGTNLILLANEKLDGEQLETTFSWVNESGAASGPAAEWPKVIGKVHAIAFETTSAETLANGGYDRVILAGEFTRVGTNDCNKLASLNKDGSVAWCFPTNAGPDAPIRDVEIQLDGKVLIAGTFTNVSGVEARGLARIHGSSAEGATYLFWADSDYAVSETTGEIALTLKRAGNLQEPLTVNLSAETTLPTG